MGVAHVAASFSGVLQQGLLSFGVVLRDVFKVVLWGSRFFNRGGGGQ